jgi:hypothetical protein
MDYGLVVGIAALVVTGVGSYYQKRSVDLMLAQISPKKRSTLKIKPWYLSPAVISTVLLTVAAWYPYFALAPGIPNDGHMREAVDGYGGLAGSPEFWHVTVAGDVLTRFAVDYQLLGVANFAGMSDPKDREIDLRSTFYDIVPGRIVIPIKKSFKLAG